MTRRLWVVPIVHTEADLGRLADVVRERVGEAAWREKQRAIGAVWDAIEGWADGLKDEEVRGLKLYQDGLPATEEAEAVARDLAASGSRNHRVLVGLTARGAELVGTEDPALLLREYEIARRGAEAAAAGRGADPRDGQRSAAILARRDAAIAERIDTTLDAGGMGLLFIGMLHCVERELSPDIAVTYPLGHRDGDGGDVARGQQGAA